MSRYCTRKESQSFSGYMETEWHVGKIVLDICVALAVLITLSMAGCPYYNVFSAKMSGLAALEKATQDRQILIQDALSKKEAATYNKEATIIQAQAIAEANAIIGESLKNNEAYLKYLFIEGLKDSKNQIIYVPTDGLLPVTEAGRAVSRNASAPSSDD